MKTLLVPNRLKLVGILVLLSIPLVALQTALVSQAPWWKLPYRNIQIWTLAVSLVSIPLSVWIMTGKRLGYLLAVVFSSFWCVSSVVIAVRTHSFWLGFFTLVLVFYWISLLSWAGVELKRSFFDPKIHWYQGLPKSIPGLACRFSGSKEKKEIVFQVCRFDQEGVFLFQDGKMKQEQLKDLLEKLKKKKWHLAFQFRGREVTCMADPVCFYESVNALGLKFSKMSLDRKKEVGDFVELLRGEGYV